MELVQAFNAELSTLYEVKPPISKAKMSNITKIAIKGIKMYKHIVQSVERFIAKCRPEYKIPGLYVVDSIVRQSRHQFGADKDVFGPRFTRNFNQTFQNLFLTCPTDDKPKIVRVLNLWQRNNVFTSETIQPLLDMANPNADLSQPPLSSNLNESSNKNDLNPENSIVMHLQQLASTLGISKNLNGREISANNENNQIRFNKKLLDFDYGDDDDEEKGETPTESEPPVSSTIAAAAANSDELNANPLALSMAQNLLLNPELFQKLQQSIALQTESNKKEENMDLGLSTSFSFMNNNIIQNSNITEQISNLRENLKLTNDNFSMTIGHQEINEFEMQLYNQQQKSHNNNDKRDMNFERSGSSTKSDKGRNSPNSFRKYSRHKESQRSNRDKEERSVYRNDKEKLDRNDRDRNNRERNDRERSDRDRNERLKNDRDRSDRDRHSRSDRKFKRSLSKSPRSSFKKDVDISQAYQSPESKEKEKERERRKKGLPTIKPNCITICSTTLWLGHLPKSTSEIDISDTFGEFGTINTIDLIAARGCAYVCMNRRQDAYKALQNLKHLKLHGSQIKMAWAPGKGMKGREFKDFWDVDLGCSYIPHDKITQNVDFDLLEDGGMIDEDTIPDYLKELRNKNNREKEEKEKLEKEKESGANSLIQNLPMVSLPSIPPPVPPFALGLPGGLVVPPLPPMPVGVPPPQLMNSMPHSLLPHPGPPPLLPNTHPLMIPPPPPPQMPVPQKNNEFQVKDHLESSKILSSNKNASTIFPPISLNVPPPNVLPGPNPNASSMPWISGPPPLIGNVPGPLQPPFLKEDNRNYLNNADDPFAPSVFEMQQIERNNMSNNHGRNDLITPLMHFEEQRDYQYDHRNRFQNNRQNSFEENGRSNHLNNINFGRESWKGRENRRERSWNNRFYERNDERNTFNQADGNRSFDDNRNGKRRRQDNDNKQSNKINRNRRRDIFTKSNQRDDLDHGNENESQDNLLPNIEVNVSSHEESFKEDFNSNLDVRTEENVDFSKFNNESQNDSTYLNSEANTELNNLNCKNNKNYNESENTVIVLEDDDKSPNATDLIEHNCI